MAFTKEEAGERARQDLAARLSVQPDDVKVAGIADADFPDMALGAAIQGEMSGQMVTPGWRILVNASGNTFEYRANQHQVRLFNFNGANYRV
jgi:hypothetical protein